MRMKRRVVLAFLPIIVFFLIGYIGMAQSSSIRGVKYALIVNTWNDFPEKKSYDVDAMPSQALQAYFVLKSLGYTDSNIILMVCHSGDDFVDVDGDGENDLLKAVIDLEDDSVTKESLRKALEDLSKLAGQYDEVLIYLIGHGLILTDGQAALSFENNDTLTEAELGEWLDRFYCRRMIILLDFCFSGNFADSLIKPGRIIVCSSEDNKISWCYWNWSSKLNSTLKEIFGSSGSAFFHPFWKKLGEGATLEEAFEYGKQQLVHWGYIDPKSKDVVQAQNPRLFIIERSFVEEFLHYFPGGPLGLTIALVLLMFYLEFLIYYSRWYREFFIGMRSLQY